MDCFLLSGEKNPETFKSYYVIRAESPPLNLFFPAPFSQRNQI